MNIKSQRLSDAAIAGRVHPRTGEPIVPIGFVGGRAVWPIMGGSGEEDDKNEDEKKSTEEKSEDDKKDDPEGTGKSDDEGKAKGGNPQAKIEDLEEEKNRQYRRRKEAEERADQLEKELSELKGKDTPETEKLQKQVSDLTSSVEGLTRQLSEARLENAFLQDNTYDWHNPGRALKLADLKDVEIDDDGSVHGLKAALDSLVKSDPYLVKSKEDKKEPEGKGKTGDKPGQKTPPAEAKAAERKKLVDKYPGLRR